MFHLVMSLTGPCESGSSLFFPERAGTSEAIFSEIKYIRKKPI